MLRVSEYNRILMPGGISRWSTVAKTSARIYNALTPPGVNGGAAFTSETGRRGAADPLDTVMKAAVLLHEADNQRL